MHVALARKYRPRAFGDLVGQEHVARALRGAVEQGRVAHGYLLCGPRGVGKTTAARILAMALNCEHRNDKDAKRDAGEPCGVCPSCERIWGGGASLDVVEIDAASNRGVDDARDLRERARYAASQEGGRKIYIIDEAHMLTREAWNTLLKVLEEPPPGVVFVFATTEPSKISNNAAPVMSRLQRFDFRRVGPGAIAGRLREVAAAEGLTIEPDALELISRVANGGLRDALSVLDQVTAWGSGPVTDARLREVLGLVGDEVYAELCAMVAGRRPGDVFPFMARLVDAGVDLVAFAEGAGDLWRAALAMGLGAKPEGISAALAERIAADVATLAPGDVLRILKGLEEAEEPIRRGSSPRLALETLVVRWTLMDRTVDIAEVLAGQGSVRPSGGPPGGNPGRRPPAVAEAPAARPPVVRDVAPARAATVPAPSASAAAAPSATASAARPSASASGGAVTLEAVQAAWPDIVAAVRAENKRILAENLQDTEPASMADGVVLLRHLGTNPLTPDSVTRNRAVVEATAARVLGAAVRIELDSGSSGAPAQPGLKSQAPASKAAPAAAEPEMLLDEADLPPIDLPPADRPAPSPQPAPTRRLSSQGARAERTKALRGKDPALDSAMDAMDLELLD